MRLLGLIPTGEFPNLTLTDQLCLEDRFVFGPSQLQLSTAEMKHLSNLEMLPSSNFSPHHLDSDSDTKV